MDGHANGDWFELVHDQSVWAVGRKKPQFGQSRQFLGFDPAILWYRESQHGPLVVHQLGDQSLGFSLEILILRRCSLDKIRLV